VSTPPPDQPAVTPPVPPAVPPPAQPAVATPAQPVVPPPARRSKLPWIIGGAALALLVIVGVVIAVVVSSLLGSVRAPQEVIGQYDKAFDEADCELYFSITTEAYQESFEPTCEGFESVAQNFLESYSDYKVTVTNTSVSGDTAIVETTETFILDGEPGTDEYTYHLVKSGNAWLIDQLDLL
jgi:hypothetical protein